MFASGFHLKLKDKRVDKTIKKMGYSNYTIYYSPIKTIFVVVFIILLHTFPFLFFLPYKLISLFIFHTYLGGVFILSLIHI